MRRLPIPTTWEAFFRIVTGLAAVLLRAPPTNAEDET